MTNGDLPSAAFDVRCYGKLPVHPEYLRMGLGSADAVWVVRWIDAIHEAVSRTGYDVTAETTQVFCFAARPSDGTSFVAGMVRQSSDGRRKHPVALFVERGSDRLDARWHLMPIALSELWTRLRALADRQFTSIEELTASLRLEAPSFDLDAAERTYEQFVHARIEGGPWTALTGTSGATARHIALNLLTVARAQREARSMAEGVAVAAPLPATGGGPMMLASVWLDVLRVTSGGQDTPTVLIGGTPPRVCAFFRPVDGADVAPLLAALEPAGLDDLSEPWQALPSGDGGDALTVDRIVAADPATFADLADRLRSTA